MATVQQEAGEQFGLLDSLDDRRDWLKVPFAVMQSCGPAVQTLAGLLKITKKETFVPIDDIAKYARVPIATARKHLAKLDERGWIRNGGRQRTRRGVPRRTCTITLAPKAIGSLEPYGVLPWWACCTGSVSMTWGARAVLSVVMAQLMKLKAVAGRDDAYLGDEIEGAILNIDSEDNKFRFPIWKLTTMTGLSRPTVIAAKHELHRRGLVYLQGHERSDGADDADRLTPNYDFRVCVTPAGEGRCFVRFKGG
ncbi:MAG TPA: hypothetical protein VG713_02550 [Pirellulales bacterium]|nr:hypothetical protein [Pirellulales bacterium]